MGQSAWMRLSPILCCLPDKWKEGANNTTEGGGRKIGENKLLSKKNRYVLCLLTWSQFAGHLHDQFCFRSMMSSSIPHKTISGEHIMLCLYADIHRIILRQYKGRPYRTSWTISGNCFNAPLLQVPPKTLSGTLSEDTPRIAVTLEMSVVNLDWSGSQRSSAECVVFLSLRFQPYGTSAKCTVCKSTLHQEGKYCHGCAYKKGKKFLTQFQLQLFR
jgi:hypothetical protein